MCIRDRKGGDPAAPSGTATLLRLSPNRQSHLRRLLPLRVRPPASGVTDFRDLTGGVYKARERIHRSLVSPASTGRSPSGGGPRNVGGVGWAVLGTLLGPEGSGASSSSVRASPVVRTVCVPFVGCAGGCVWWGSARMLRTTQ